MHDYFLENSIGRCRYTNIVAPYYRALHPKSYYTDPSIPQPQRAYELMNEALTHHKANGFDFSSLTADSQPRVGVLERTVPHGARTIVRTVVRTAQHSIRRHRHHADDQAVLAACVR